MSSDAISGRSEGRAGTGARASGPRTRKPAGPCSPILVFDADPGARSTVVGMLADFIADPGTGPTYWLDVGQERDGEDLFVDTAVDSLALIDHDGSWSDIREQIQAVHDVALAAAAEGRPPVVLVINSLSQLWEIPRAGVVAQSLISDATTAQMANDPAADIQTGRGHWRAANARWQELMAVLLQFPGIVLATTRMDSYTVGQDPATPEPVYRRPDLPNDLLYQVTACVQVRGGAAPVLIVANTAHARAALFRELPDLAITDLLHTHLGIDPATVPARVLQVCVEQMAVQLFTAPDPETLRRMRERCIEQLGHEHPTLAAAHHKCAQHLRLQQWAQWIRESQTMVEMRARWDRVVGEVGRDQPIVNRAVESRRADLLQQCLREIGLAADPAELDRLEAQAHEEFGAIPALKRAVERQRARLEADGHEPEYRSAQPERSAPSEALAATG